MQQLAFVCIVQLFSALRYLYLWICLYLKVVVTEVALHPELEDGGGVVPPHCRLLGVVTDTHTNVSSTSTAPDVIGELKPN